MFDIIPFSLSQFVPQVVQDLTAKEKSGGDGNKVFLTLHYSAIN